MASLRLNLDYVHGGQRRSISAGPVEAIAFERRYKTSLTKAATDGLSVEALAYLCYAWQVNREGLTEPFDAWLPALEDIEPRDDEPDPTGPPTIASNISSVPSPSLPE